MPTYQYRCKDCDTDLEVVQKFTDDALTECPSCDEGELRKVYNAVGVVFKGSGFYRTDSRSKGDKGDKDSSGAAKSSESTAAKSDSTTSDATKKTSGAATSAAPATASSSNKA